LRPLQRRSRPWLTLLQGQIAADGLAMLWAPAVLALTGVVRMVQALGLLGRRPAPLQPPTRRGGSPRDSYRHACAALGVAPGSSWEEVRAAWRRQLPHWHPDRGGDLELWHQRQSAYRLLADLKR
jgi:hypothetical protein